MKNLLEANILAINQLIDLLHHLPTGVYHQSLKQLHEHSIGQHTRHVVEFYDCLLNNLDNEAINYDARQRDLRIETDRFFAINCLENMVKILSQQKLDRPLNLYSDTFGGAILSSLSRELVYMVEHTIHHLAIIKIGLNEAFPTIALSDDFGVAPSTLKYRQQQSA
jgi:uncharacterized damage-inducible protein DinB